jgi:hypothetical protein
MQNNHQAAHALPRLTKVSAAGLLLPDDAPDWVAAYDSLQQLTFMRREAAGGAMRWEAANSAASAVDLCGWAGQWRLPTRLEYQLLIDDTRCNPAVDPRFFGAESSWEWTGTAYAGSPSGYAWCVDLCSGYSSWNDQYYHYHVRAVRAGQLSWPLDSVAA